MMMSASLSASAETVAPAAVNSESGKPDLIPAPGSIAISAPSALNFFTVSGEAATRGSDGSISLATAIFMGPPAARKTRRRHFDQIGKSNAGLAAWHKRAFSQNCAARKRRKHYGDQTRKIAINATIAITVMVPYFTSLM